MADGQYMCLGGHGRVADSSSSKLCSVADFYRRKRDAFEQIARQELSDVADWVTPVAGMFLFLRLKVNKIKSGFPFAFAIRRKLIVPILRFSLTERISMLLI
jgi:DNA-binding transcriptional MocR family regulator